MKNFLFTFGQKVKKILKNFTNVRGRRRVKPHSKMYQVFCQSQYPEFNRLFTGFLADPPNIPEPNLVATRKVLWLVLVVECFIVWFCVFYLIIRNEKSEFGLREKLSEVRWNGFLWISCRSDDCERNVANEQFPFLYVVPPLRLRCFSQAGIAQWTYSESLVRCSFRCFVFLPIFTTGLSPSITETLFNSLIIDWNLMADAAVTFKAAKKA